MGPRGACVQQVAICVISQRESTVLRILDLNLVAITALIYIIMIRCLQLFGKLADTPTKWSGHPQGKFTIKNFNHELASKTTVAS